MRARRTWGWVAVAATAVGIVAGTAFAKGSSSTLKGTIEGDVENERQKPVQGAEVVVEVEGKPPLKATTDASGHFTLAGVPVGDVKVKVLAKGYYPWEETIVVAGKGSTHASATLKLGVRLAGKVVDEKGAPVEGVTVRAGVEDSSTWVNGVEIGVKRVTTAADGTFQIDGLGPARRYELTCRHPHFETMHVKDLPGKRRSHNVGHEPVLAPVAPADHVAGASGGHARSIWL